MNAQNMGAVDQVECVSVAYNAFLNEAKEALAEADWFEIHEDRLPYTAGPKRKPYMQAFIFDVNIRCISR
jgi:hypothetical protein